MCIRFFLTLVLYTTLLRTGIQRCGELGEPVCAKLPPISANSWTKGHFFAQAFLRLFKAFYANIRRVFADYMKNVADYVHFCA